MGKVIAALAWAVLTPAALNAKASGGTNTEAPTPDTIIVTGTKVTENSIADFVKAVTVETSGDQLAAFHAPVCPVSFGLPDAHNEVIEKRIRAVADEAGIELAEKGCSPNIAVFIADDGAELITRLRAEHPDMFAGRDASDNKGLILQEGPVRAWHVLDVRGSDGRQVQRVTFLDARGLSGGSVLYLPHGEVLDGVRPSNLVRSTRQDLALSYVVIDVAAIDGLSLAQVADHAAMRTLAQTDPDDAAAIGQPTILTLFFDRESGATPAEAMTEWDMAFLKSLYETRRTVSAGLQRSGMRRIMGEELETGAPQPDQAN